MASAPAGHAGRAPRHTSGVQPGYAGEASVGEKSGIVPNPVEEAPDLSQPVVAEPYRTGAAPRREVTRHREDAAAARRHEQELRRSEDPRSVFVAGHGVHPMHKSASTASLASTASSVGGLQSQYDLSETASMASMPPGAALPAELGTAGLPPIPKCFRCFLSQEIMEDPVVCASDGNTYERRILLSSGYAGDVIPNVALKEAIQGYMGLRDSTEQRLSNWKGYLEHQEDKFARKLGEKKTLVRKLRANLEKSRKRAEELSERKATVKSTGSTTASSHEDGFSHCSAATPQSDRSPADEATRSGSSLLPRTEEACYDSGPASQGEERSPANEPSFKTGPAPRGEGRGLASEPSFKTGPATRSEGEHALANQLSFKSGPAPRDEERILANEPSFKTGPAPRGVARPLANSGPAPRSEDGSLASGASYKTGPAPRSEASRSEAAPGAANKLRHPQRSAWSRLKAGLRQA